MVGNQLEGTHDKQRRRQSVRQGCTHCGSQGSSQGGAGNCAGSCALEKTPAAVLAANVKRVEGEVAPSHVYEWKAAASV